MQIAVISDLHLGTGGRSETDPPSLELRTVAELTPYQSVGSAGTGEAGEHGWAYGFAGEVLMPIGSVVSFGAGISVSALHGERLDGHDRNRDVSGWLLQVPLLAEFGFPDVEWGRFTAAVEFGGVHAAANNTYYSEEQSSTYTHGGLLLGLRVGYVHWLSHGVGVIVNAGIRASLASDSLYASLGTRLGVSWRLESAR